MLRLKIAVKDGKIDEAAEVPFRYKSLSMLIFVYNQGGQFVAHVIFNSNAFLSAPNQPCRGYYTRLPTLYVFSVTGCFKHPNESTSTQLVKMTKHEDRK